MANGKCSVVSRKQAWAKSRAHTKNFAPLTKQRIPKVKVICAFFFLLSFPHSCHELFVYCVCVEGVYVVCERGERGSVEGSIEFGCQRVASTLRMRNISPQQQWQSVLQWDCIEAGERWKLGKLPQNFTDFYDFQVVFFCCCLHYHKIFISCCLCRRVAFAAAWFNSIERIPFSFIFL